ncbi:MAG: carboxypeptidase-like regulatory domain-containing protein [Planctomycetota bacterium]
MSRVLVALFFTLALVAGLLYFVLGTEPAPAPASSAPQTNAAPDDARTALERESAADARTKRDDVRTSAAVDSGTFEIVGRLLDETGAPALPVQTDPRDPPEAAGAALKPALLIVARHAAEPARSVKPDARGAFALRGLAAGEWRVRATVRGFVDAEVAIVLDERTPRVERDLVLRRIEWASVEVVVRDGRRAAREARASNEDAYTTRLFVDGTLYFARRAPTLSAPPWFEDEDAVVLLRELAAWSERGDDLVFVARCRVEPEDLARGFFVSLALGATSLETKRVEDVARPTQFVVGGESYAREFARLSLRVVDLAQSTPIEGARVELVRAPGAITEREEMLEGGTTDAKGELRLAFLRPGAVRVVVRAPDHETCERTGVLRAGEELALGTLSLGTQVVARGRVVDASGAAVRTTVELVTDELSARDEAVRAATDADGAFELRGLARRAYVLRLLQPSTVVAEPLAVDLRGGSVQGLVLHARKGTRVSFELAPQNERFFDVDVRDASGRAVATALRSSGTGNVLFLLPGAYQVVVRDGEKVLGQRSITVTDEPQNVPIEAP